MLGSWMIIWWTYQIRKCAAAPFKQIAWIATFMLATAHSLSVRYFCYVFCARFSFHQFGRNSTKTPAHMNTIDRYSNASSPHNTSFSIAFNQNKPLNSVEIVFVCLIYCIAHNQHCLIFSEFLYGKNEDGIYIFFSLKITADSNSFTEMWQTRI